MGLAVCGGYFSGRMRWRKETGSVVSAPSQLVRVRVGVGVRI